MRIKWIEPIPNMIRKRLTAESRQWEQICDRVEIEGGVNECRVSFYQFSFPTGWTHRRWIRLKEHNNKYRKLELQFVERILADKNKEWFICSQLDRQIPYGGRRARSGGQGRGDGESETMGIWRKHIFPWLSEDYRSHKKGKRRITINRVKFYLSSYYPFRSAHQIELGDDNNIGLLKKHSNNEIVSYYKLLCVSPQKYLKELGHRCLCCESITCTDRWYPQIHLYMVLLEIVKVLEIRQRVLEKKMADRVVLSWTPWLKAVREGREDPEERMLAQQYIPDDLRIRTYL